MPRRWFLRIEWQPRDLWVGLYWDVRGADLHVWFCLVPMLPLHCIVRDFN